MAEPNNYMAQSADWPKTTLDLPALSAEELRYYIQAVGDTVEHFKTLDAYKLALASGKYPWLADL